MFWKGISSIHPPHLPIIETLTQSGLRQTMPVSLSEDCLLKHCKHFDSFLITHADSYARFPRLIQCGDTQTYFIIMPLVLLVCFALLEAAWPSG